MLILCEGKTEYNYFHSIRTDEVYREHLRGMDVAVSQAKKTCSYEIVREAIKRVENEKKKSIPYDQVWLVFDHDAEPKRKLAYETALKKKYNIAFSSFCFEVWYILHFTQSLGRFQDAKQVENALKKYWKDYEKVRLDHFKKLKPLLPMAFVNTERLKKQTKEDYHNEHISNYNPYCDVDNLVNFLIKKPK